MIHLSNVSTHRTIDWRKKKSWSAQWRKTEGEKVTIVIVILPMRCVYDQQQYSVQHEPMFIDSMRKTIEHKNVINYFAKRTEREHNTIIIINFIPTPRLQILIRPRSNCANAVALFVLATNRILNIVDIILYTSTCALRLHTQPLRFAIFYFAKRLYRSSGSVPSIVSNLEWEIDKRTKEMECTWNALYALITAAHTFLLYEIALMGFCSTGAFTIIHTFPYVRWDEMRWGRKRSTR